VKEQEENVIGVCDMCGEKIYDWCWYYEMPDGLCVCAESDCLEDWAKNYIRRN
jgi:hypothetical protein